MNENFSQTLINEVPPIEVDQRVVSCDGGKEYQFLILGFCLASNLVLNKNSRTMIAISSAAKLTTTYDC